MDPIETFVHFVISGYALIIAYLVGWATPRGNTLRKAQLWLLRKVHNFLAREDERIQDKIKETKKRIVKNR